MRPHNDGMAGSLVAVRDALRKVARNAAADPALPALPAGVAGVAGVEGTERMGTGEPKLLTVSGLSVSYGRIRALNDISLSVRSGELVALAGENGAGKTSLLQCIAGAVVPASG